MVEIAKLELTKPKSPKLKELRTLLNRVEQLHEVNPMLGLRGCRLGITYPEITEMQARAIFEAAVKVAKEGVKVKPEIMIPLTTRTEGDGQSERRWCARLPKRSSPRRNIRSNTWSAP